MGKVLDSMKNKNKYKRATLNSNPELNSVECKGSDKHSVTVSFASDSNEDINSRVEELIKISATEFKLEDKMEAAKGSGRAKAICDTFMEQVVTRLNNDSVLGPKKSADEETGDGLDDIMAQIEKIDACTRANMAAAAASYQKEQKKMGGQAPGEMTIEQLGKLVTNGNSKSMLPVHVTAALGDLEKVRQYFEKNPDTGKSQFSPNGRCMTDGSTPLHLAIRSKNVEVAKVLLENGADPTLVDYVGDNALMTAIKCGDANIINAIWPHRGSLNIDQSNVLGMTALHLSTDRKWECCTNFLLQNRADPNCQTTTGLTPLMIAASKGDMKAVERLVKAGADILMEDHDGVTSICKSYREGKKDITQYLLANIPEDRREYFVRTRLEIILHPSNNDDEKKLMETLYYPILEECTEKPEFRNAFYNQRVIHKLTVKMEGLTQSVEITMMTSILIFAIMIKFGDEVDAKFMKQYMNAKGPDLTIHIVKYYTEVCKMPEKSTVMAFLPMIGLCEIPEGRVWLKKNYVSVSEYLNFFNKDSLKVYMLPNPECHWCLQKGHFRKITHIWHRFHDVMYDIQTEQREKHMFELLKEEEREKERKEKRKEKKKQKRQGKQKKENDEEHGDDMDVKQKLSETDKLCPSEDTTSTIKEIHKHNDIAAGTPIGQRGSGNNKQPLKESPHAETWKTVQTKKQIAKEKERSVSELTDTETNSKKKQQKSSKSLSKNAKKKQYRPIQPNSAVINNLPLITDGTTLWADVAKGKLKRNEEIVGTNTNIDSIWSSKDNTNFVDKDFPSLNQYVHTGKNENRPGSFTFHFDAPTSPTKDDHQQDRSDTFNYASMTDLEQSSCLNDAYGEESDKQIYDKDVNMILPTEESISKDRTPISGGTTAMYYESQDIQSTHVIRPKTTEEKHDTPQSGCLEDETTTKILVGPKDCMVTFQEILDNQENTLAAFVNLALPFRVNDPFFDPNSTAQYSPFEDETNVSSTVDSLFETSEDIPSWFNETEELDEDFFNEIAENTRRVFDTDHTEKKIMMESNALDTDDPAIVYQKDANQGFQCKQEDELEHNNNKSRFLGKVFSDTNANESFVTLIGVGNCTQRKTPKFENKSSPNLVEEKQTAVIKPLQTNNMPTYNSQFGKQLLENVRRLEEENKDDSILFPEDLDGDPHETSNFGNPNPKKTDDTEYFFPSFHDSTKLSAQVDPNAFSIFHRMQLVQLQQLEFYYQHNKREIMKAGSREQTNFIFYAHCAGIGKNRMEKYLNGDVKDYRENFQYRGRGPVQAIAIEERCQTDIGDANQTCPQVAPHNVSVQSCNVGPRSDCQTKNHEVQQQEAQTVHEAHGRPLQNGAPQHYNGQIPTVVPVMAPPNPGSMTMVQQMHPSNIRMMQTAGSMSIRNQVTGILRNLFEAKRKTVRWRQDLLQTMSLLPEKLIVAGKIIIPRDTADRVYISHQSTGPVVLGMLLSGLEVAVKIIDCESREFKPKDLQRLVDMDVSKFFMSKYLAYASQDGYYYVAMGLYEYTLPEFICKLRATEGVDVKITSNKIVWQLLRGLANLHQHFLIVHGELRPENIVIDLNGHVNIAWYGLGKNTNRDGPYLEYTDDEKCWLAPEVLNLRQKVSFKSDIWVAGMLIYFTLSGCKHPFGCNVNDIIYNLSNQLYAMDYVGEEAGHLLSLMLSPNKAERPCTSDALKHPFFWADEKKLRLIMIAGSDVLRDRKAGVPMDGSVPDSMISIIGTMPCNIKIINWVPEIESVIMREMKAFRQYKYNAVELVLFVYNCCQHFDKMSKAAREIIDEPCKYFLNKFPTLFMTVYRAIKMSSRTEKTCYKPFF